MAELIEGQKAPDFALKDQNNKMHTLSDYKGSWLLIYFYPKDNTPGCTKEACALRDEFANFKKMDAKILGISKDSAASHEKFIEKFKLQFPLLVDDEQKMAKAYGVWKEKSMFGKKYMGMMRYSFLINQKGEIAKIYKKVKPDQHAEEVLVDLQELQ